jgi:CRISPR/Cas system Type II protein with McrA/HNH and RuvC-like nuclease domain
MKKIVGLDIGVSSIGWSFVLESEIETDEETEDVIELGSRIIPLSKEDTDEFSKGQAITKHKARTQKRTARKTNNRYKLRKHKLGEVLRNQDIKINPELFNLTAHQLYALRVRAIYEPVTLSELVRLWYQFNQKRGYLLPWLVNPLRPVARSPDQPSGNSNVPSKLMSEYQIVMIYSDIKICSSACCHTMVRWGHRPRKRNCGSLL